MTSICVTIWLKKLLFEHAMTYKKMIHCLEIIETKQKIYN